MSIPSMDFKSNKMDEMISRMKKAHNIVIFVYANWCGHCHRAMPMYKSLVKKPKQNVFNLSVESEHLKEVNSKLKREFPSSEGIDVQGYPTLLVMDKDGHVTETLAASPENMRNATSGKIASTMNNNVNNNMNNNMNNNIKAASPVSPPNPTVVDEEDEDDLMASKVSMKNMPLSNAVMTAPIPSSTNSRVMTGGNIYGALASAAYRLAPAGVLMGIASAALRRSKTKKARRSKK